MKIIPLITYFTNTFNETFKTSLNAFNLESKIRDAGDSFTLKLYEDLLNYIDDRFKWSNERKKAYTIKQTTTKTLVTSIGVIRVNSTSYYSKDTHKRYVLLRDLLKLKPYQRLTNEAEYQLIKYAMSENMSQSAKHALRNIVVSRSTVSKKIAKLDGSIDEIITKSTNQPETLYIEMDEIHANLQKGGNKICPCAIVHEGYEESFVKRKQLKNIHYFASSKLSYVELWEVIFDYVDKKYDINKFKNIFVSGDGAPGIKDYENCFPNAIFVLDSFHYQKKHLQYIFKDDTSLKKIADDYIRNDLIKDFKYLVKCQIDKYPEQEKCMKEHMNYILNNLDGIKNQDNPNYICRCSMESHVNQAFARHITSSPYGFSEQGLNNKLKLLVYHANKHELTIQDYYNLKYGLDYYNEVNINIKKLTDFKYKCVPPKSNSLECDINTASIPTLDCPIDNDKLKNLITPRHDIYII
jgi:hypothetical protein